MEMYQNVAIVVFVSPCCYSIPSSVHWPLIFMKNLAPHNRSVDAFYMLAMINDNVNVAEVDMSRFPYVSILGV